MKFTQALLALPAVASAAHFSKEQYESGEVHQMILDMKNKQWDALEAAGALNSSQWPSWSTWDKLDRRVKNNRLQCRRGVAVAEEGNPMQTFRCDNMDLYDFMNHNDMGGGEADPRFPNRRGSSIWGWVGPRNRQIALIGQQTGTAFVEVDRRGKMTYLGRLPSNDLIGSSWREIRVLNNFAIIGSEAVGHNVQIFDMNKVAAIDPANPVTFSRDDVEGIFDDLPIGRAHNIVIDWDNEYAIAVGAQPRNQTCAAGLEYINLDDPANPFKPGSYNEDSVTVWDSTDKANSQMLSRLEYPGATYCHQGWWTERNWHQFVLLNDELDETEGVVADGVPITHIIDLTDLRNPKHTGTFKSTDHRAVDHNLYIEDGVMYQSNYGAGVWVKDVRSIARHPDGSRVRTLAFFDMHPEDDAAGGSNDFVGSWGNFQFPSGFIVANTFERGAYVLRVASGRGRNGGRGFGGKSR
ncbi:putative choice-of-anchor B domain-containing protein [Septoria linicola]|nr:putative choice-of-anchor B domain-containing protein [Septoria linicola]